MIKRILVGIADPNYTAASTRHALEVAHRCGATVTGISILDVAETRKRSAQQAVDAANHPADESPVASVFQQTHESIDAAVDKFVRLCSDADVRYEFKKISGDPFAEFIDCSKYHDFVVCGLRHLFEHGVLPEPKDELVKLVSAGVHPMLATGVEFIEPRRVLIAYSNSVESARTMRAFTQSSHLLAPNAEIQLLSFGKPGEEAPAYLPQVEDYLLAHGIDASAKFVEGTPRTELLDYARTWGADMVVMGNSAKNLLRRQIFGETAIHTIRHAEIPLFLAQ